MKWLTAIGLLLLTLVAPRAFAQSLPMSQIGGVVMKVDGTVCATCTITFDSVVPQTIAGIVVQPILQSRSTDINGNLSPLSLPQGLVVQMTAYSQGVNFPPTSGIIPMATSSTYNQINQGILAGGPTSPPPIIANVPMNGFQLSGLACPTAPGNSLVWDCLAETGGVANYGILNNPGLAAPAAPTVTVTGTAGTTTYWYYAACHDGGTGITAPSTGTQVTTSNATLSAGNYNSVAFTLPAHAASCDLLRNTSNTVATAQLVTGGAGLIATQSPFHDVNNGTVAPGYTPGTNTTGNAVIAGSVNASGNLIAGQNINLVGAGTYEANGTPIGGTCGAGTAMTGLSGQGALTCAAFATGGPFAPIASPTFTGTVTIPTLVLGGTAFSLPVSITNGGLGTSTAPTAGQFVVAQSTSAYGPVAMSGDATITTTGAITVTKTSGTAFSALATATTPLSIANGGRGSATAPTLGQIDVASSTTAFTPVTMSNDCVITSTGAITCNKTNGVAFSALATAPTPLSIANGGRGSATAPTAAQIDVAQSTTAFGPVTLSGDAAITTAGVLTVSKINGITPGGTCTSPQFVQVISASGVPTCATPASGGVPNGAPPQIVGYSATNTGEAETLSGDATLTRAGANSYTIAVTKTGGTAFSALATAAVPLSVANGGRGSSTAPAVGQIDVASSTTAFTPVTMSGDATITSAGVITVTKTSGTAFTGLATATIPLSVANGGIGATSLAAANIVTQTGAITAGNCVKWQTTTSITDAGATCGSGTGGVTSVGLSGGTTGLTVTGSPITTSGTMTLGGTLAIANGGTGSGTLAGANIAVFSGTITAGNCVKWLTTTTVTDAGSACGTGGGGGAAIFTHTLTAGTSATLLVNSTSPAIDVNYETPTGNFTATTPAAASMGDGQQIYLRSHNTGTAYTVGFTAGTGVTLRSLVDTGAVGAACPAPATGDTWYRFQWDNALTTLTLLGCGPEPGGTIFTPPDGSTWTSTGLTLATASTFTLPDSSTWTSSGPTLHSALSVANGGEGNATAPTAGQFRVAASATSVPPVTMSGDATLTSTGAITVTKTSGTAFSSLATASTPLSIANGGNGTGAAPTAGQIEIAQSGTAWGAATMSGDCTITSAGAITCTKTNGTAFTALATAATPLSVANGGEGNATAPTAGQFRVAASATSVPAVTMSGDATLASSGAITVTKTSGTAFTALATASTPLSVANGGEGNGTAPSAGQIRVAASATSVPAVTMSGAATITSAGVVSLTTPVTLTGTTSSVGFDYPGLVGPSAIGAFTCVVGLTIPANFVTPNSVVTCGVNPSESDAYTVKVNGATVGTLTISTTCVITRGSASSTTCSAGQRMEIDAPATVSGQDIAFGIGVTR